ncbi:uncharacterized protein V1510DRAFT_410802 [Dipodascopsis tothii]|uniref:uncharacterized protein n=1 Tax=Dipodascopsis tothii TaxID=44089 RepID=UPI0034CFA3C1
MNILQRSSSSLSFFDIRLYSADRDVVIVRGNPDESAGVVLKGAVVFSVMESVSIKKISLRLYGVVRLNWQDSVQTARGLTQRTNRFERVVYEHTWNFLEWEGSKNSSHTVGQGNHEYPFEVVLPGAIHESVEGLDGGSVVYKMKATVERGRFANNMIKKKHVRIVRTLGPEALELSQTMSIENIWPNKVDYSISIPSKAVAIGSATPVHLILQPLLKGLKLGTIQCVLKEYYTLQIPHGPAHANARTVAQHTIPAPDEDELGLDVWDIRDAFEVPASLHKCTQDCDIDGFVKIRHKLKFAVSLKNPDGHVSELRASLPITLFISPHVAVNDGAEEIGSFGSAPSDEINAPPRYDDHIYDRLWQDIPTSGLNTPMASGANTPRIRSRRNSGENADALGFTALDMQSARLHAGLSALALSQAQAAAAPGASDSYFPPRGQGSGTPYGSGTHTPLSAAGDDGHWPGVDQPSGTHISRGQTPIGSPAMSAISEDDARLDCDLGTLSRVPSYTTALRTPIRDDMQQWLPSYDDEEGNASRGSSASHSRASTPPISRHASSSVLPSLSLTSLSGLAHKGHHHDGASSSSGSGQRSRSHFFSMKKDKE